MIKICDKGIYLMRKVLIGVLCLLLSACNSVYLTPHSLDKNALIYTPRGGFTIQRSIKQVMDERGYKTHNGFLRRVHESTDSDRETYEISHGVRYSIRINERKEILRPIWCMFNGFWWWNFEVSISDRKIGKEIMSWRGRGCQNSSLRKLNAILDELEMRPEDYPAPKKKRNTKPQMCEIPDIVVP